MDRLYVIFPAYNEQANLSTVLEGWYPTAERTGPDSRLVVVNDGGTDGTAALLARLQERMPQLEVLTQANGGTARPSGGGTAMPWSGGRTMSFRPTPTGRPARRNSGPCGRPGPPMTIKSAGAAAGRTAWAGAWSPGCSVCPSWCAAESGCQTQTPPSG